MEEKVTSEEESLRRRKRVDVIKRTIRIMRVVLVVLPAILFVLFIASLMYTKEEPEPLPVKVTIATLAADDPDIKYMPVVTTKQEVHTSQIESTSQTETTSQEESASQTETTEDLTTEEPTTPRETQTIDYSDKFYEPYQEWDEDQKEIINRYKDQCKGAVIYLTFDDGPSIYTNEILDILDYYKVKATFFTVAKFGDENEQRYKDILSHGHTLAMHSYTHKYANIYESIDTFDNDINMIRDLIFQYTGYVCKFYRFPGGSRNTAGYGNMQDYLDYLEEKSIKYFDWNSVCGDGSPSVVPMNDIVNNVMSTAYKIGVNQGEVMALLHDSGAKRTTVDGLPLLIETLLNAGFDIRPITDDTVPVHQRIKE